MVIKIERMNDNAQVPTKGSEEAAGFDLYLAEAVRVNKGCTVLCKTGIKIELPVGYEGQVRSRSGLAKDGLVVANSPGTVDSDYRGEVGVLIHNQGKFDMILDVGHRIAQLVIKEVPFVMLAEVSNVDENTARGNGGFGSTGV